MDPSPKINVMHLRSSRGKGGGPEKTILFSAKEIDATKFNLHIVYLKSPTDKEFDITERAQQLQVENFIAIDDRRPFDFRALRQLLHLLKKHKIDILHCHGYKSNFYGVLLARFHKMQFITTCHGWVSRHWKDRLIYHHMDRFFLRFFERILIVTETMRNDVVSCGVSNEHVTTIRNAIDSDYFKRDKSEPQIKDDLKIPRDCLVIGAIGRLEKEKDLPTLFEAARILLKQRQDVRFVIVGKGSQEAHLKALAVDLGISDYLIFAGHFQDIRSVFSIMDIYVLSSIKEGLPNTVIEAMAMEVPIVATTIDGVKEAVTDGQEALLAPARTPGRLAEHILRLLPDDALRERLVTSARTKVMEEFSFAKRMRNIENIYTSMMAVPSVGST
jgi:glycosyltransferase involved in cell wall biosynthesis